MYVFRDLPALKKFVKSMKKGDKNESSKTTSPKNKNKVEF